MKRAAAAVVCVVATLTASARAEDAPADKPPSRLREIAIRGSAGASRGELYGRTASGVSFLFGGSIDARTESWGGFGGSLALKFDALSTERTGIALQKGIVAVTPELLVWRLRVGVGAHVGFVSFSRVSGSGDTPSAPIAGFHATLTVDIFRTGHTTLFASARGDRDILSEYGAAAGLRYAF